jgi:hypothetical protein
MVCFGYGSAPLCRAHAHGRRQKCCYPIDRVGTVAKGESSSPERLCDRYIKGVRCLKYAEFKCSDCGLASYCRDHSHPRNKGCCQVIETFAQEVKALKKKPQPPLLDRSKPPFDGATWNHDVGQWMFELNMDVKSPRYRHCVGCLIRVQSRMRHAGVCTALDKFRKGFREEKVVKARYPLIDRSKLPFDGATWNHDVGQWMFKLVTDLNDVAYLRCTGCHDQVLSRMEHATKCRALDKFRKGFRDVGRLRQIVEEKVIKVDPLANPEILEFQQKGGMWFDDDLGHWIYCGYEKKEGSDKYYCQGCDVHIRNMNSGGEAAHARECRGLHKLRLTMRVEASLKKRPKKGAKRKKTSGEEPRYRRSDREMDRLETDTMECDYSCSRMARWKCSDKGLFLCNRHSHDAREMGRPRCCTLMQSAKDDKPQEKKQPEKKIVCTQKGCEPKKRAIIVIREEVKKGKINFHGYCLDHIQEANDLIQNVSNNAEFEEAVA